MNSPDLEYYTGSEVVTLKLTGTTLGFRGLKVGVYGWFHENGEPASDTFSGPEAALAYAQRNSWVPNDIMTGLL